MPHTIQTPGFHDEWALALGEGLPIIGRLLGHRQAETTARYAHLDRGAGSKTAERVASRIAGSL